MSNTITPTVFYRTLNVEELEIFYPLDTAHFALEEEVDRIGSLMHEFLDRTIKQEISIEWDWRYLCP
jgi:hypothetical protein